jgi:hypothetical protein
MMWVDPTSPTSCAQVMPTTSAYAPYICSRQGCRTQFGICRRCWRCWNTTTNKQIEGRHAHTTRTIYIHIYTRPLVTPEFPQLFQTVDLRAHSASVDMRRPHTRNACRGTVNCRWGLSNMRIVCEFAVGLDVGARGQSWKPILSQHLKSMQVRSTFWADVLWVHQ